MTNSVRLDRVVIGRMVAAALLIIPLVKVFRRLPPPDARHSCALTIGNFDGVHRGHQALIAGLVADARRNGLISCVLTFEPHPREFFAERAAAAQAAAGGAAASADGVASAESVAAAPGPGQPVRIANLRDKLEALAALDVDQVCVAHFNHSLAATPADDFVTRIIAEGLHARHLLIGDDFRFGAKRSGDFALLQRIGPPAGIEVRAIPTVIEAGCRISSSLVREALGAADFARVAHLLGRPYRLSGRVIHGRRLGRELGFPTLNLRFPHGRPALCGVFIVKVYGIAPDGQALRGVASLGTRPAVEKDGRYLLEVHLLDWSGEAYGKLARVEFLHKIRDEEHFDSLDGLSRKIDADSSAARAFFSDRRSAACTPGCTPGSQ